MGSETFILEKGDDHDFSDGSDGTFGAVDCAGAD